MDTQVGKWGGRKSGRDEGRKRKQPVHRLCALFFSEQRAKEAGAGGKKCGVPTASFCNSPVFLCVLLNGKTEQEPGAG